MRSHPATLGLVTLLGICATASRARAANVNAASCASADVQTAINSATSGDTVNVPACPAGVSWTSGVKIAAKGITLQGAGGGRVVGVSVTSMPVTIGTGSKSFSGVIAATVGGVTASDEPAIVVGQTLRVYENGFLGNHMDGTVTSFAGGVLTMNVTSSAGTCGAPAPQGSMQSNCKRWLIATPASTVLLNDLTAGAMVTVVEDSHRTAVTGLRFAQGANGGGVASGVIIERNNTGGVAVLVHDNFFESNKAEVIDTNSNRGVVWDNSFVFSPFSPGQFGAIRVDDPNNNQLADSWATASTMGTDDKTGESNFYFESNDIHATGTGTDFATNARVVFRYNLLNNAGGGTHGADTDNIGVRHFEFYNNAGLFQAYTDGATANMNWWLFVRGGTFVWHDNTLPAISSQDFGDKPDIALTVMTLQRKDNFPCWGAGFSTPGQYYHAPRQIGFGRLTGMGTVTYPPLGYVDASTTSNPKFYAGAVYVGDSEPAYIWNNNRPMKVGLGDYGLTGTESCPNNPTPDSTKNYLMAGRDYFENTPKPNYTPYPYPHPLRSTVPSVDGGAPTTDGGSAHPTPSPQNGGCGCDSIPGREPLMGWVVVALAAIARWARKRRASR